MKLNKLALTLMIGGLLAGSAVAQSGAGPGVYDPNHPRVNEVNQREQDQQNRIAQGIKSGQLTPGETSRLERQENRIQRNERRDMRRDGGHLTRADQARLNREENHVSRHIYADKHNRRVR